MNKNSINIETIKTALKNFDKEQFKIKPLRSLSINNNNKNTINDLESIIREDLSYDVPITYKVNPDDLLRSLAVQMNNNNINSFNNIRNTSLFKYKQMLFRENLNNYNKFIRGDVTHKEKPFYPIVKINGKSPLGGPPESEPLLYHPTTTIHAETSDKFVAILDILKNQEKRINELELKLLNK